MTNKKELLYISFLCLICCVVFFTFGEKAPVAQANLLAAAEEVSIWQSKEVYMVLGIGAIMLVLIAGMIIKKLNS